MYIYTSADISRSGQRKYHKCAHLFKCIIQIFFFICLVCQILEKGLFITFLTVSISLITNGTLCSKYIYKVMVQDVVSFFLAFYLRDVQITG